MEWREILSKREYRIAAAEKSVLALLFIYLSSFIKAPFAPFHWDLDGDLIDENALRLLCLMFRESAKSVINCLALPLHSVAFNRHKFIIFGSDEEGAAAANMTEVKNQLCENELFIHDFGQLYIEPRSSYKMNKKKTETQFFTVNDIRFLARGVGQKVRGLRHGNRRPDLFIGDDFENINNVDSKKQRDKRMFWILSEVLSALDQARGKVVINGNILHSDAVMVRLSKLPNWKVHKVPLIINEQLAWPARWVWTRKEAEERNRYLPPDQWVISVEQVREDKGSLIFAQEYLMIPISNDQQIILDAWIQWYEERLPLDNTKRFKIIMAVDPAISESEKADYSAATVWAYDTLLECAYCVDYINAKLLYPQLKAELERIDRYWKPEKVLVEDVAAQNWLIQDLRNNHSIPAMGVKRRGDKRSRLVAVSHLFEKKKIFFRKNQTLIVNQLLNLGNSDHDDLADTVSDALAELFNPDRTRLYKKR